MSQKGKQITRGPSVLERAAQALKNNTPIPLEWDVQTGETIGDNASIFASWCGKMGKKYASCNVREWDDLDKEVIDDIMNDITGAFQIPKEKLNLCLTKASTSWRQWKSRLYRLYVKDQDMKEVLKSPPIKYPQITKDDWKGFVTYRNSEEFKAISQRNKANIDKKESVWHGSRGGYRLMKARLIARLRNEGKKVDLAVIDRHLLWKEGHKNMDGEYDTEYDADVAKKIDELIEEDKVEKLKFEGSKDILGLAIGKPEHPGRVRGLTSQVGVSKIFGRAKPKKSGQVEDKSVLKGAVKSMAKIMRKFIRGEKLTDDELLVIDKMADSSGDEGVSGEKELKVGDEKEKEKEKEGDKREQKRRERERESSSGEVVVRDKREVRTKRREDRPSIKEKITPDHNVEETSIPVDDLVIYAPSKTIMDKMGEKVVRLIVWLSLPNLKPKTIVAEGLLEIRSTSTVVKVHGTIVGEGFSKVSVTKIKSEYKSYPIPVPTSDTEVLEHALKTFVQWPNNLIYRRRLKSKKNVQQEVAAPRVQEEAAPRVQKEDAPPPSPKDDPYKKIAYKRNLSTPTMVLLDEKARLLRRTKKFAIVPVDDQVVGYARRVWVSHEDVFDWCDVDQLGYPHVTNFMKYLRDVCVSMGNTQHYGFMCSQEISTLTPEKSPGSRTDYIASRLTLNKSLIFAPYNDDGRHWVLAAINPRTKVVYWMDPFHHPTKKSFLDLIFEAFQKRDDADEQLQSGRHIGPQFRIIMPPRQHSSNSRRCGYFVLRYMMEIIQNNVVNIPSNFINGSPTTYTKQQFDEIRDIWGRIILESSLNTEEDNLNFGF